jgi:hypothetical protein
MPEIDNAVRILDDGRYFTISYRTPGTWFLQAFLSEESAQADDDPLMAAADHVPDGRDYLTDREAAAIFDEWVPRFLDGWEEMCERLGVAAGATRREGAGRS